MREITTHRTGLNDFNSKVKIEVADEPNDESKAHSKYAFWVYQNGQWNEPKVSRILFQEGPYKLFDMNGKEYGQSVNGLSNEALIAVIIDRLQCFNTSKFSCRENSVAITHLETALLWLKKRTWERVMREVEGTRKV